MIPHPAFAALVASTSWIEALLLGSLGTVIATIAVAVTGMGMLAGRIDWQRGARVVVGCAVIFGASRIAGGVAEYMVPQRPSAPIEFQSQPFDIPRPASSSYDPYAGVSPVYRRIGKEELRGLLEGGGFSPRERQSLTRAIADAKRAVESHFPDAAGLVRIKARLDSDGRPVDFRMRSRMLNPVVTHAIEQSLNSAGLRFEQKNVSIDLPAILIGAPEIVR